MPSRKKLSKKGRKASVLNARAEVMKAVVSAKGALKCIELAQQALVEKHEPASKDLAVAIKALRAIASSYAKDSGTWAKGLASGALRDMGVKVR